MSATVCRRVFCLVPARSGSIRIADKNLQVVGGLTLLERAVRVGLEAFGTAAVSTDSARYAKVARDAGADVPGLRPRALAAADTPIDAVVQHVLSTWVGADADVFVLVQATTPFLLGDDLRSVVAAVRADPAVACALTVARVSPVHGSLMVEKDGFLSFVDTGLAGLRTQDVPPLALPTGGAFAARVERLRRGEPLQMAPFAAVWVPSHRALDIDDADDLAQARAMAGERP